MALTTVDLFRSGNSTSACLDKVRTAALHSVPDIDIYIEVSGDVYVRAHTGGASTSETIDPIWSGKVWKLPAGSSYSDLLTLVDDGQGHWSWEPSVNMKLSGYRQLLADMNPHFAKI
jgi:hypothetical protein